MANPQGRAPSTQPLMTSTPTSLAQAADALRRWRPDLFVACVVAPIAMFFVDRRVSAGLTASGCISFRPLVFLFASASAAMYVLSFRRRRAGSGSSVWLAGPLFFAAAGAALLGLVLPLSAILRLESLGHGLMLAGTAICAAVGYRREARLALESARRRRTGPAVGRTPALSAFVFVVAALAVWRVEELVEARLVSTLIADDSHASRRAERALELLYSIAQVNLLDLYFE